MAVPAVDILFIVAEVPRLDDLMVVEEVLEGLVSVDFGETAVEDSYADTLAVDAEFVKLTATHAYKLVGEGGRLGGQVRLVRQGGRGGRGGR